MAPGPLDPNDPDARRLDDLEERLQEARNRGAKPSKEGRTDSSMAIGLKMSFEIVAAVVVGAGLGWALDRWLGTAPLFMIVCFFLGAGTGFYNVIRSAGQVDEDRSSKDRK
jgi:ATP synthase protein I